MFLWQPLKPDDLSIEAREVSGYLGEVVHACRLNFAPKTQCTACAFAVLCLALNPLGLEESQKSPA